VATFWNVSKGKMTLPSLNSTSSAPPDVRGTEAQLDVIAASPKGDLVALGGTGAWLWDGASRKWLQPVHLSDSEVVTSLTFRPDGHTLAVATWPSTSAIKEAQSKVRLWDVANGSYFGQTIVGDTGPVWALRFDSNGTQLMIVSNGEIKRVSLDSAQPADTVEVIDMQTAPERRGLSADGHLVAVRGRSNGNTPERELIYVWDL
jgi:WD40 repeat protein